MSEQLRHREQHEESSPVVPLLGFSGLFVLAAVISALLGVPATKWWWLLGIAIIWIFRAARAAIRKE
jgi:hypothetical protein